MIRRRLMEWAAAEVSEQVHALALRAYDRMIGLELDDLAVDGCITKAQEGGEVAGRSPVDRGKQGLKRSIVTEATGIRLHPVSAGGTRHDSPLLEPTLAGLDKLDSLPEDLAVHLDRGNDSRATPALLAELSFDGAIARKGIPTPVQAGSCRVVEQLPLAAKQMLGAARAFVSAPETCQRLPERALLAGSILTYLAATLPAVPTGSWDRRPRLTPGRLRRRLVHSIFPAAFPLPDRIRKKPLSRPTYQRASGTNDASPRPSQTLRAHLLRPRPTLGSPDVPETGAGEIRQI